MEQSLATRHMIRIQFKFKNKKLYLLLKLKVLKLVIVDRTYKLWGGSS